MFRGQRQRGASPMQITVPEVNGHSMVMVED